MKIFTRSFKWLLVTAVLAVNLVVGARIYSQETAAAETGEGKDSPLEMLSLIHI